MTPSSAPSAASTNPISDFFRGAADVWRGFGYLLVRPSLWIWVLIPFLLNMALFVGLFWLGHHLLALWVDQLTASGSWWLKWAGVALELLFWIFVALIVLFAFVPMAFVVSAPFNDVLSEKVERLYARVADAAPFSLARLLREISVTTLSALRLALATLGLHLCTLPLYLVPVVGAPLAGALSTAFTIRFLVLEFTSYSMDRRAFSYAQRRDFLRRHRARTWGMGAMAFLVMLAPVLNALFIPASAVSGTLLFCDTALRRNG